MCMDRNAMRRLHAIVNDARHNTTPPVPAMYNDQEENFLTQKVAKNNMLLKVRRFPVKFILPLKCSRWECYVCSSTDIRPFGETLANTKLVFVSQVLHGILSKLQNTTCWRKDVRIWFSDETKKADTCSAGSKSNTSHTLTINQDSHFTVFCQICVSTPLTTRKHGCSCTGDETESQSFV